MNEPVLRLLCLDGGGIRGLASLYVLQAFLDHVGNPLPCHFFDMIAGSSTGGLIAIMLGRLEMSIQQCIDTYTEIMEDVFRDRRELFRSPTSYETQSRYSSDVLKASIQRVIEQTGLPRETLMRDKKSSACKTFVVAVDDYTQHPVQFADFASTGEQPLYQTVKIWEAALATSALPTFFDAVTIGGRKFLDGALGHRNPVIQLWAQAQSHLLPPGASVAPHIRCLMSIGTGRPRFQRFGTELADVAESMRRIAEQTEITATSFRQLHGALADRRAYYRLNPDYMDILPDRPENKGDVAAVTEAWLAGDYPKQALIDFRETIGALPEISSLETPRPLKPFYKLKGTREHLANPDHPRYWRHLTLAAWQIYEDIYQACKNPFSGLVSFTSFDAQFSPSITPRYTVEDIWGYLTRDPCSSTPIEDSSYSHGITLAALYMLHMARFRPDELPPKDDQAWAIVNSKHRKFLKLWGNWVRCGCEDYRDRECKLQWNFADDKGMCRPEVGRERTRCRLWGYLFGGAGAANPEEYRELYRSTQRRWDMSKPDGPREGDRGYGLRFIRVQER